MHDSVLTRNASWDDNDVGIGEGLLGSVILWQVTGDLCWGGDMGEIGRNTWGVDNIIESQLINVWGVLEEEGQWLWAVLAMCHCPLLNCKLLHTCPIPPEAPATTAKFVSLLVHPSPSHCCTHTSLNHVCDYVFVK
jgi:hypothetical protein